MSHIGSKSHNSMQVSKARAKSSLVLLALTLKALDIQKLKPRPLASAHSTPFSSVQLSNKRQTPQIH